MVWRTSSARPVRKRRRNSVIVFAVAIAVGGAIAVCAQQPPQQPQKQQVPMTPTQQPQKQQPPSKQQVDSSLFVTTPTLPRVEPNPAESPLKRTKRREDEIGRAHD